MYTLVELQFEDGVSIKVRFDGALTFEDWLSNQINRVIIVVKFKFWKSDLTETQSKRLKSDF